MSKFALILSLLCWCVGVSPSAGDSLCEAVEGAPSCVCRSPKGVIDLTKIANFDGTPRITGVLDPEGYSYDYNPCSRFIGPYDCIYGQYFCQHTPDGDYARAIANLGSEEMWIDEDGEPYLSYGGRDSGDAIVHLVCDHEAIEPVLTTTGESGRLVYEFTLRSMHACPAGGMPTPEPIYKCEAVGGAPSCVCRMPDGVIDLTKLAFYNSTARFTGTKDENGFVYDYNPCFPFSETESCSDVHVCQREPDNGNYYGIGDSGSEEMKADDNGNVFVHYIGLDGREVFVYLNCDQLERDEPVLTTTGDSETLYKYDFFLTSCQVCPGGCSDENEESPILRTKESA